jgi:hypothetical protein
MQFYRKRLAVLVALMSILWAGFVYADSLDLRVGAFSESKVGKDVPADWSQWILKNVKHRSVYSIIQDDSPVVMAKADDSASGLMRNITVDPRRRPIITWRWKVAQIIEGSDIARKDCNDAPARVYVAFAYDINKLGLLERLKYDAAKHIYSSSLPLRAISYTWANKTPKDSIVPMPYTAWFSQIVVENAGSPTNKWITEKRDVYEDYRKVFGEAPTAVTGVAIMTNTDDTGTLATAWYGDIVFKEKTSSN